MSRQYAPTNHKAGWLAAAPHYPQRDSVNGDTAYSLKRQSDIPLAPPMRMDVIFYKVHLLFSQPTQFPRPPLTVVQLREESTAV